MAKKIPMRQCVGCGEMKNKKDLMRVLKTAEDSIVLDMTGRKNGRGALICVWIRNDWRRRGRIKGWSVPLR